MATRYDGRHYSLKKNIYTLNIDQEMNNINYIFKKYFMDCYILNQRANGFLDNEIAKLRPDQFRDDTEAAYRYVKDYLYNRAYVSSKYWYDFIKNKVLEELYNIEGECFLPQDVELCYYLQQPSYFYSIEDILDVNDLHNNLKVIWNRIKGIVNNIPKNIIRFRYDGSVYVLEDLGDIEAYRYNEVLDYINYQKQKEEQDDIYETEITIDE